MVSKWGTMVRAIALRLIFLLFVFLYNSAGFTVLTNLVDDIPFCEILDDETFTNKLDEISESLDRVDLVSARKSISFEFLHTITNDFLRVSALQYTRSWIANYGDIFPEGMLLHCMAGGKMDPILHQYGMLDNPISKNCARWCLMVRSTPLDEDEICAQQGSFFYCDEKRWYATPAVVYIEDNKIFKPFTVKRKGLFPKLQQYAGGHLCVVRDDQVPVPWGSSMYPDLNAYPFVVPNAGPHNSSLKGGKNFSVHTGSVVDNQGGHTVGLTVGDLSPRTDNKTWKYFASLYSPFMFLSGQAVAPKTSSAISGRFHRFCRIRVSSKRNKSNFCEVATQDIVISNPINFELVQDTDRNRITFAYPGVIVTKNKKSNLSRNELLQFIKSKEWKNREGREEIEKLMRRRLMYRLAALISSSVLLISAIRFLVRRRKERGQERG
ncbi:hypothetical protein P4C99_21215 [Pontiellaceae bacterium B1224]|nr:hypothetical protein [Pontiellaceae bacterium B1224]